MISLFGTSFNQNRMVFSQENAIENVVYKMAATTSVIFPVFEIVLDCRPRSDKKWLKLLIFLAFVTYFIDWANNWFP